MDELTLIEKCVKNDIKAQRILFDTWYHKMFNVALRYLNNREDAEDTVAVTFKKVFENINRFKFENTNCLGKWIVTITINESLRHLALKKPLEYKETMGIYDLQTYDYFDENIDFEILLELIRSMPDGYRVVFNLFVMEKYSHAEIAETLGVSVSTSKSQLFKARQYLIEKLKKMKIYEVG